VGGALVLGLIHVLLVAPHYHVGSFDDDASYILAAKAILAGHGLTSPLASGQVMVGLYPPGYSALLVPLLGIFGQGFLALRALSVVCYAALFPLTWHYLGRRRLADGLRVAVLLLLALCPVLATFGSMVMAEAPFLVLFLIALLVLEQWQQSDRTFSAVGACAIVSLAGLVWLKEAALAMIPGVVVWLLLQRQVRKAIAVAGGSLLLLAPVAIARLVAGVPLAGARYSQELGSYYTNNLFDRIGHVAHGFVSWFSTALPATVLPWGGPLPQHGASAVILRATTWHVGLFCVVGFVVWLRRHRDAAIVVVPFYFAETLLWPNVNERRVILVLPVILAWYVLGGWEIARFVLDWARRQRWPQARAAVAMSMVAALLIVAPLGAQFTRDYLFNVRQNSSQPEGSRYMALLTQLGRPQDVVETDYRSTAALFTGHRTANNSFLATSTACSDFVTDTSLSQDKAGYLLIGAVNKPLLIDSQCLFARATSQPWAVRLLRTDRDLASVFELIGPGTAHPDLVDATAPATVTTSGPLLSQPIPPAVGSEHPGAAVATSATNGVGVINWTWQQPTTIEQVSVGAAGADSEPTSSVSVELLTPSGSWVVAASTAGSVGDAKGAAPYLLAQLGHGVVATAMRVVIHGQGLVSAEDVHALATRAPA
jgi:hypothetical protein